MTDFKLSDLMPRFEGWEVVSTMTYDDITEIRVASSVEPAHDWIRAHGAVFVAGVPQASGAGGMIGERVSLADEQVSVGKWELSNEALIAGQLLESAIILLPDEEIDPVNRPAAAADALLESGSLIWPSIADLPEEHRGLEVLEGITNIAFRQPSLVVSVNVGDGDVSVSTWDVFVTPYGAVESESHPENDDPVAVSYFPLSDLPSRLFERSGVARLIGAGSPTGRAQTVDVRTTYMDERGLVAGALAWEESDSGDVTTEDGSIGALSLGSELLRMLPGGDLDFDTESKGVVGSV